MDRLINDPPMNVNVLLMEGTCIGREDKTFPSEDELVPRFVDVFKIRRVCLSFGVLDKTSTGS